MNNKNTVGGFTSGWTYRMWLIGMVASRSFDSPETVIACVDRLIDLLDKERVGKNPEAVVIDKDIPF